jgi:predicted dehydrogenase
MSALRVGCIGAGYFSRFHFDAWSRLAGAQLVAVADPDLTRAGASGARAYGDAAEMLAAETPDIVDIIAPPPAHLALIEAALRHKPQVIICQKPFCRDLTEAQRATALAQDAGVPLVIHENFRFQPWYRAMRAAMDADEIGAAQQLTFRLRPGDGQGPRAYLDRQPYFQQMPRFLVHETAVHWIDTFRYLMGPARRVFADLRQMNPAIAGEDAGYLLFDHGGGRRALFDGNRLLDHAATNTRCTMGEALVEGPKGTLTLLGDGSVHLRRFGDLAARDLLAPSAHEGFGGQLHHSASHCPDWAEA